MPENLSPLIYVLAFVAMVLLVQTLASQLFSSRDQARRVNRRLTMLDAGMKPADVYAALVRQAPESGTETRFNARLGRLRIFYQQAALAVTFQRYLTTAAAAAAVLWLLSWSFLGVGPELVTNGLVSLIGSCAVSAFGAYFWVNRARNRRLKALEEQMPLALDVINRAIRAGHPVVSAVQLAATEMGDPIGSEFGLIVDETTYGYEFKDALRNFARRTGSPDAHFFAVSVGIQSQTGGNLGEILAGLAAVIRGRVTLGKRVKALASEGRASAMLLSALPPLLIGGMLVLKPSFYTSKFSDPVFWPTVAITCVVYVLGWWMINRIVNIKY
jgi:tight adherence protein B